MSEGLLDAQDAWANDVNISASNLTCQLHAASALHPSRTAASGQCQPASSSSFLVSFNATLAGQLQVSLVLSAAVNSTQQVSQPWHPSCSHDGLHASMLVQT